jgi:membrane protease YdiL (CAAX protease family)
MINSIWVSGLELFFNCFDKSLMPMLESVSGDSDTFSMFLYAAILAPIAEELLFRGYILRSLMPYGKKFAVFASAFLFGAFHGNLIQTPYAFLMGLVLGYVAVEYSAVWAIGVHTFNNLVLADLLTRLTANLPDQIYNAISLLLFGGFLLVSLVILLVKRRQIRAYNRSEWMDRRCVKCLLTNSGFLVLLLLMLVNMLLLLIM